MTEEKLKSSITLHNEIEDVRKEIRLVESWDGDFRTMSCDHRIIPEDIKAEVTKNVSQVLKMRLNLKLEKLEKQFAD